MSTKPRKRNKSLLPLPEGVTVGDTVSYYSRGWHYGKLDQVKGNEAGIHVPAAYGAKDKAGRLKWVGITDIKKIDV